MRNVECGIERGVLRAVLIDVTTMATSWRASSLNFVTRSISAQLDDGDELACFIAQLCNPVDIRPAASNYQVHPELRLICFLFDDTELGYELAPGSRVARRTVVCTD